MEFIVLRFTYLLNGVKSANNSKYDRLKFNNWHYLLVSGYECWQIESVSSEDIDSLVTSISLELSQQKANLAQRSASPPRHLVEPRFVLDKKSQQPHSKIPGYCHVLVHSCTVVLCDKVCC